MIYYRAKENNRIKSLNKQQYNTKDGRRESVSKLPQPQQNIYFPEKNYTCKETEKCDPYTGKAAGNRNCERAQMSHLIDTGFKEATINIFKELKETRIRGKKWKM